jgi:hypothetical protein
MSPAYTKIGTYEAMPARQAGGEGMVWNIDIVLGKRNVHILPYTIPILIQDFNLFMTLTV